LADWDFNCSAHKAGLRYAALHKTGAAADLGASALTSGATMKRILAGLALLGLYATVPAFAQADSLLPLQSFSHRFSNGASIALFYTTQQDGWRVVATTQGPEQTPASVMRMTTVLMPGQDGVVSVPAGWHEREDAIRFWRDGDRLVVTPVLGETRGE
jgi:hypothetical protein